PSGAPTGQAALVLRNRGIIDAMTVHGLIYRPIGATRHMLEEENAKLKQAKTDQSKMEIRERIQKLMQQLAKPQFILREPEELPPLRAIIVDEASMVSASMLE